VKKIKGNAYDALWNWNKAPAVNVGIMSAGEITFAFNNPYVHAQTGDFLTGEQRALWVNGNIIFNGRRYDELFFEPVSPRASFTLKAVTIGVDFHWQRREEQSFRGALNMVSHEETIVVINQINLEEYLTSVISSEMNAAAPVEFLKAHAVISRSWLLAQIGKTPRPQTPPATDAGECIRWYDREDHDIFDVCADDHCQRYQGVTRASTPAVVEAVGSTRGEVLLEGDSICDARFSKCCGGITEKFENVWEPVPHPCLTALRDSREATDFPDLAVEDHAQSWIRSAPPAFCNAPAASDVLRQVLNDYDLETTDFYRWQVSYTQEQLAGIIRRKSGVDFGQILALTPLKRGSSGRLEKLKITGTRHTCVIGKELEIRRTLSETHLYSSAFVVDAEPGVNGVPRHFTLTGAGWGHGVGLCQIGAAVMTTQGYTYQQILSHYYPGSRLARQY
jgi:SpoIID/LytB domain protein